MTRYLIVDFKNAKVWDYRRKVWTNEVTSTSSYVGIRGRAGVCPSAACEKAHDNLYRDDVDFQRNLEINSIEHFKSQQEIFPHLAGIKIAVESD